MAIPLAASGSSPASDIQRCSSVLMRRSLFPKEVGFVKKYVTEQRAGNPSELPLVTAFDLELVKTENLAGTGVLLSEDVEVPSVCLLRLKAGTAK